MGLLVPYAHNDYRRAHLVPKRSLLLQGSGCIVVMLAQLL